MQIDPEVFSYVLDKISTARSQREIAYLLFEMRDLYRLENIVYLAAHIEGSFRKNPILMLTYEHQWVQEYTSRNYFRIDPTVVSGRQSNLPLDWKDVDREPYHVCQFFKKADSYGVGRQGYTIPIRTHPSETVLFTFTSNVKNDEWEEFRTRRKAELLFIGQQLHEKIVNLRGMRASVDTPGLTPRELHCLHYLVAGSSAKDIARSLGLSPRTVRFHFDNVRAKLSATTLSEAAARAIKLEIVKL